MSLPQPIHHHNRRQSIAKLTRSPMSSSPMASLPSRMGLLANNASFVAVSGSSSPVPDEHALDDNFSQGIDDPRMINQVAKHLAGLDYSHEGADITWDIHKLNQDGLRKPRRSRSWSSKDMDARRRGSTASSLNVPGGFRRAFLVNNSPLRTVQPSFLTKNFIEFLSIYGHFAGEDLEDEDNIACHYQHPAKYDEETFSGEETPLLRSDYDHYNPNGTANDTKTYFLLIKAFIGTGVLFLPKSFSNGGLLFSVLTLVFFGFLSYWCYLTLIFSKIATRVSSFSEIGAKLYGRWFQQLILFSIVISQIGFVSAYIVFTAENLRAFISTVFGWQLSIAWMITGQFFILVPLSLIRDITKLSLSSVMANGFILIGLLTIIYYLFYELLITNKGVFGPQIEYIFNSGEFSLFIGVAIFAFEGIGLIIPIQESMIHPNHFPKVLGQVMLTISTVFIFMGTLGYLTFGSTIQTVILLNLPQGDIMIILIQLLYSFAILLSTPLQLFPAIRLVESKLIKKTGKDSTRVKWLKNCFRFFFVLLTSYIALVGGQNLDRFISFVGCFACIPLVYMYPPILHIKSCCNEQEGLSKGEINQRYWLKVLDYILIAIGGVAMVYTTYDILK
ncbi:uncharacterized protein CANTADRAFT_7404 [Suhomyces tanzawaensis NRRL Y-17324]|uniref:Amino acid transporter transmembrane domain-containing protein n=1 Tax=Suhomyces tanzawaensis NRRL Y-17324 TaxID=984487 RepID=A0A1E4SEH6_9ASCO|nr:uncharacterized protein CANTADRAFT_7404 [Suhomyces tanzawaensis NRRL Y-17324]ODV77929.1 hypothetical protein CANTADRAFT_7404 [Suhomyces tanzawaensis NRRL Y-17324]